MILSNHIFSSLFQNLVYLRETTGNMYHTRFDTGLNIYRMEYMYYLAIYITALLRVGYIGGFSSLKFPTVAIAVGDFPFFYSECLTNPS